MTNHSQILFNQFQTTLNEQKSLTRKQVLETFQQIVDSYFQTLEANGSQLTSNSKKSTKPKKTPTHPPNSQWPKIISSKDFGLTKYFTTEFEDMKTKAGGKVNYFTAIKNLRDEYEGGERWTAYLAWVRTNNPNAPADDPPARGQKTTTTPTAVETSSQQQTVGVSE